MTRPRLAASLAAVLSLLALGVSSEASAQMGMVELVEGPPGAEVWVNGELQGTLPQASVVTAPAGQAVIEIRPPGGAPVQRMVQVRAGVTVQEALGMVTVSGSVSVGAQPQPQPQPYQVQPQPYQTPVARPINAQPGYRTQVVETHPNWALFGIGAAVFGATWITTWAVGLAVSTDDDTVGLSFAPVIGPFVLATMVDATDTYLTYVLVIDGVAQAAGLAFAIIGLVSQQTDVVVAQGPGPRAPRLALRPLDVAGAEGVSLALTHF